MGIEILPAGINPNGFYPANGPNQAVQFPTIGTATHVDRHRARVRPLHRRDLHRRRRRERVRRRAARSSAPPPPTAAGTFTVPVSRRARRLRDRDRHRRERQHLRVLAQPPRDRVRRQRRRHGARPRPVLAHRSPIRGARATVGGPWTVATPVRGLRRRAAAPARSSCPPRASPAPRRSRASPSATSTRPCRWRPTRSPPAATTGSTWSRARAATPSTAAIVRFAANGAVFVQFSRVAGQRETAIGPETLVSGPHAHGRHVASGCACRRRAPARRRCASRPGPTARSSRAPGTSTQTNSEAACRPPARSACARTSAAPCTNAPITVSFDELRVAVPVPDDGVAPAAPQGLVATPGSNRVALTWTAERRERHHRLPRLPLDDHARADRPARRSAARARDGRRLTSTPPPSTTRPTTTSSSPPTRPHGARAASNEATATPNAAAGSGLQLNGSSQYVTLGCGTGAGHRRTSRSSCGSGAPARAWERRPAPAASPTRSR